MVSGIPRDVNGHERSHKFGYSGGDSVRFTERRPDCRNGCGDVGSGIRFSASIDSLGGRYGLLAVEVSKWFERNHGGYAFNGKCDGRIFVLSGARHESPKQTGIAHALEHLLFRGSLLYPKGAMSPEFTQMTGTMNAFTTWEYTCFYSRSIPEELPGIFFH